MVKIIGNMKSYSTQHLDEHNKREQNGSLAKEEEKVDLTLEMLQSSSFLNNIMLPIKK